MPDLPHACAEMVHAIDAPDYPVEYHARFREYGIRVLDGGTSVHGIGYCPFCGARLPSSERDEWFDLLEAKGLEPGDPGIPADMLTDAWWRARADGPDTGAS